MTTKPQLHFTQILNMCFGFFGIQFGFALQNTNVSRIFQTLGGEIDQIAILWIAAPVTGLLVQPIIGYMSDNTWNRFGRRHPYFLVGAVLSTLALFVMPNSPVLWVAAITLWVLDASINICTEPFRAFVGDMLPREQYTTGFATQSFFIGAGAIVASALPWIMANWFDISNTAVSGAIPESVIYSFYAGAAILLLAVLWTVVSTKEYSPAQLKQFKAEEASTSINGGINTGLSSDSATANSTQRSSEQYYRAGMILVITGAIGSLLIAQFQWEQQLHILTLGACLFGAMQLIAGKLQQRKLTQNGFYRLTNDIFLMPDTMKQLAVVQFFSWFGLFSLWIYTTPAVTYHHFGSSDTSSALYNQGADWVGLLFAAYNGFAALAAFMIPWLANATSRITTHMINLCLGGLGFISIAMIKDPSYLMLSMVGVGIAWASILSMPYAILSEYLPGNKLGTYMGIFNFFIVIPQIIAAAVLGLMVKEFFAGQAIYALVTGGCSLILAAVCMLRVNDGKTSP